MILLSRKDSLSKYSQPKQTKAMHTTHILWEAYLTGQNKIYIIMGNF